MSYAIDANLLIYASDATAPNRAEAQAFLERCGRDAETCGLAWITVMAYLRVTTHPTAFDVPLEPAAALANMERMLALPHVRLLSEQEGFLAVYRDVTSAFPVRGKLVPDAHLAALLKQHDVRTLYTTDTDFRKFTFLDVRNPLIDGDTARGRDR